MRVLSPRRTAAASLLPPAVPAQTGMRLVREMRRSFQVWPVVRRKARAAATARLLLSLGRKAQAGLRRTPPGEAQVEGDLIAEGDRLHHHLHLVVSVGPGP